MRSNFRILFYVLFFAVLISMLVFKLTDLLLKKYTLHDNVILVPSLVGLSMSETQDTLEYYNLTSYIIDSAAYNPNYNRGAILSHQPKAGSEVKPGRKIYLTTNPLKVQYIPFPNLVNKSLRQAIILLENNAFRVGDLKYIDYYARDVIRFSKVGDSIINHNDSLPKFQVVDLYLGNGHNQNIMVPDLVGLEFGQVKKKLNNNSLNLGDHNLEFLSMDTVIDTLKTIIYKQEPQFSQKVPLGSYVSIWLKDSIHE